ncbi:cation diffusion facilitator family transporter [Maricaulis sp.]|uniref:cation diffusion facilitator family transporter n=1 Tax=Maricaulis sp. TaxID=1486257 RepID=UPI002633E068|nr:cation diffusion facilitator family transporter [Maricaulis sp.]
MPHDHHHAAGPGRLKPSEARKISGAATWASLSVALILTATKAVVWYMSGSVALLASMADSLLDLTASLTVFFAVRYAAEPADAEHRFGHGKAEAFASILQAMLVAVSAALLLREGVAHTITPVAIQASGWALGVMGLSIILTLGLLVIQTRAIAKTGSVAVEGDRAHYFTDLGANLAVMAGIAGSVFFGLERLDGLAALCVAAWLAWAAWQVAKKALDQLLDRELPEIEREEIRTLAEADPRIIDIHDLRTRASGPLVHIQFHMALDPDMSLADAHEVLVDAENRLLAAYPAADILIHADPHGAAEPHGAAFFGGEGDGEDGGH